MIRSAAWKLTTEYCRILHGPALRAALADTTFHIALVDLVMLFSFW